MLGTIIELFIIINFHRSSLIFFKDKSLVIFLTVPTYSRGAQNTGVCLKNESTIAGFVIGLKEFNEKSRQQFYLRLQVHTQECTHASLLYNVSVERAHSAQRYIKLCISPLEICIKIEGVDYVRARFANYTRIASQLAGRRAGIFTRGAAVCRKWAGC